jgi:hypothetical protein
LLSLVGSASSSRCGKVEFLHFNEEGANGKAYYGTKTETFSREFEKVFEES